MTNTAKKTCFNCFGRMFETKQHRITGGAIIVNIQMQHTMFNWWSCLSPLVIL